MKFLENNFFKEAKNKIKLHKSKSKSKFSDQDDASPAEGPISFCEL